jgi:hypothetical protein
MAISENDKKRILYPFERPLYPTGYTSGNHNYDSDLENRMFGTSINLNIVEGKVECPVFTIQKLYNLPSITLESLNNITIPLYSRFSKNIKTVSSVINAGFDKVQWRDRLMEAIMPNEEIYYINKGIILDKDMNPIIVYTWDCNISDKSYNNPKVYVNPIIFTKINLPLYKDIINKFIPVLMTERFTVWDYNRYNSTGPTYSAGSIKVIFEEYPFIRHSVVPNTTEDHNTEIVQLLENNRELLLTNV